MKKVCNKIFLLLISFFCLFSMISCGNSDNDTNNQNDNVSSEEEEIVTDYKLNFYVGDSFIDSFKFSKNQTVNLVLLADLMNEQLMCCNEKFILGWCKDKKLLTTPLTKIVVDQSYNLYAKLISSYQATMIYYTKSGVIETDTFNIHYNDITRKVYCDINAGDGYTLNLNLTDGVGTYKDELMEPGYDTTTNQVLPKGTIMNHGECTFFLNYKISNSLSTIEVKSRYVEIKYAYNKSWANLNRYIGLFDNAISNICYNQIALPSCYTLETECNIYCIK